MRVLGVVVLDVDAEDPFEVAPVEDQQPVAALGAHGANETLGNGVRLWCADRGAHDPDLFAAQDLVERAAVLAVAVADQEADLLLGEAEAEVTRLLGHPVPVRIGGAAGEADAAACVLDEEKRTRSPSASSEPCATSVSTGC